MVRDNLNSDDIRQMAYNLALLNAINKLVVDYKDVKLTKGQIYKLYQSCDPNEFEDIIIYGAAEDLP